MRLLIVLGLIAAGFFVAGLVVGPAQISPFDSLRALFSDDGSVVSEVMLQIRLPRAILAALIGGGLGLAGAAMQGYLRNPLADPGLIGVSGSAAVGAVIALQTGFAASVPLGLPAAALLGAFIGVALVLLLAGPRGGSITLILAGIAIASLSGALVSLVLNLSPNPFAASEVVFWMMGSLADRSMDHVWIATPLIILGAALLLSLSRALDALTLGEDAAEAMGIGLVRVRLVLVIGTAAIVAGGTAVAGAIGFVGLVVPHILRGFVGARPGRLLWASALGGAIMLMAADLLVRVILPERDLKLGVLTAMVGAPLFLHLIYRTRRETI